MARMESPTDRTTTASAQLSGERLERLETYCEDHDLAKSEVIRRGIDAITDHNDDGDGGRVPPADNDLATAYKALRRLTDGGDGWVRQERACSHLAQRVNDYNKNTVYGGLLRPLAERNYLRLASDAQGRSSAVYVYP